MPLSEHEQRILDEIERRLAAEDPKFARSTALATPRGVAVKTIKRAVALFVVGLALLIGGLFADRLIIFGLASFAVMLFSVIAIARASRTLGPASSRTRSPSWFSRAEDRWKKRFERGDDR